MKKVHIIVFVSFMLLSMNAMAQNGQEQERITNVMGLPTPFALDFFNGFMVPSDATPGLSFLSTDTIKNVNGGRDLLMKTFKDKKGKCISLISEDKDNYIWFIPQIQQNKITGENEIVPSPTDRIICFKKLRDNFGFAYFDGVALFANMISEAEYVITNKYKQDNKPYWKFSDWANQSDSEKDRKHYFDIINKPIELNKAFPNEESCKNSMSVLTSNLYISKNERIALSVCKLNNSEFKPTFRKESDNYYIDYSPKLNQINATLYLEPSVGIALSAYDRVKTVTKDGNIITVTFVQPDDFLKYTLFSHGVFDGHLTRISGYFITKNDNPDNRMVGTYYMKSPISVTHSNPYDYAKKLGEIVVPAGCHSNNIYLNEDLMGSMNPNNTIFIKGLLPITSIYDEKDVHICDVEGYPRHNKPLVFLANSTIIALKQEAAEKAALEKKEKTILNKYKQKYGVATIDNIMKGIIKVGMPWALIKEVFANGVLEQSTYSTTYKVINNIPRVNLQKETLEIQEYGFGTLHYVTVRNGKVSNVWTTNHR